LHDDAGLTLHLAEVVERGDVRVLEAGLDARLVEEALAEAARLRGLRQDFDGRDAPDLLVHRAVDLAHPARAEEIHDAVLADRLVGVESATHNKRGVRGKKSGIRKTAPPTKPVLTSVF